MFKSHAHKITKRLGQFFNLLRISQYVKNCFVLLPLFFSGEFFHVSSLVQCGYAFCAFCLASSSVYILNDIRDAEEDRRHPVKRNRPIASGAISPQAALWIAALLLACCCLTVRLTGILGVYGAIGGYLVLNVFYVYFGRQKAILDVACISTGFILRAMAGSLSISQDLSQWLVLMIFLLCMFLGLGKRWDDLCLMGSGEAVGNIRSSIAGYSKNFVFSAMTFLSTINTICYIIYTMSPEVQSHYHHPSYLYFTSLWVILGNLRYLQLTFVDQKSMSPAKVMLHDRGIQICVLCWVVHIAILLYF